MQIHPPQKREGGGGQPHSRMARVFAQVLDEFKHHTDPANHKPVHIEPIHEPLKRMLTLVTGVIMLIIGGIGLVTPIMPTWPFVLVALFCFARSSARVRAWVLNNHVFRSVMSLVLSRPERPFAWARAWLKRMSGETSRGDTFASTNSWTN